MYFVDKRDLLKFNWWWAVPSFFSVSNLLLGTNDRWIHNSWSHIILIKRNLRFRNILLSVDMHSWIQALVVFLGIDRRMSWPTLSLYPGDIMVISVIFWITRRQFLTGVWIITDTVWYNYCVEYYNSYLVSLAVLDGLELVFWLCYVLFLVVDEVLQEQELKYTTPPTGYSIYSSAYPCFWK